MADDPRVPPDALEALLEGFTPEQRQRVIEGSKRQVAAIRRAITARDAAALRRWLVVLPRKSRKPVLPD